MNMQDVIIVGGSAAGLSAALYLGRFRRRVIVFDTQRPANRFSHAAHGFFTRDGVSPAELVSIGRQQLGQYDSVQLQTGEVTQITPDGANFRVMLADGSTYSARKIILATGIKDTLPPIQGIMDFWGKSIFHCPYCDGWEQRDKPVGIIADAKSGLHVAGLLQVLTDNLVICTNGDSATSQDDRALLQARDISLIETPIAAIEGSGGQIEHIVFTDGQKLAREAAFVRLNSEQHSGLPLQLGCAMTEGGLVQIDEWGQTSVPGVYAAGDIANRFRQIIGAAMQGASAAVGANMALIAERDGHS